MQQYVINKLMYMFVYVSQVFKISHSYISFSTIIIHY